MSAASLLRSAASSLVALSLLACDSPTGNPQLPSDNYALRSIANVAVPAPWTPNPAIETRMLSASLRLWPDGTGTWHAVIESEPMIATYQQDSDFTYVRTGAGIEVSLGCPDNASCIAGPHLIGDVTASGIIFTTSLITRAPLVFDAVQ
ncbi:MAG TPA: hypothetical protein VF981_15375 [Gemmatimonadaceae bacterium]